MSIDQGYMQRALELAELGRYTCSPNPMVGCVLVKDNKIIGEGYHQTFGEAHAEINALKNATESTEGATLYVSLEPCCHHGKTPPCTDAIIKAGIKKVVIACLDPNPQVAGRGIEKLQAAGIETETKALEKAAIELNKIFFHYITKKTPYIICKWAMSLDGKTITAKDDSRQISNSSAQTDTHLLRAQVDAILIGSKTANDDNPRLTARDQQHNKQPWRIVLASHGELRPDLNLLHDEFAHKTIIATTESVTQTNLDLLQKSAAKHLVVQRSTDGQVCISDLLKQLAEMNISSILVEGGETIHQAFIKSKYVNEIKTYIAPVFIGALSKKLPLHISKQESLDNNIAITAQWSQ